MGQNLLTKASEMSNSLLPAIAFEYLQSFAEDGYCKIVGVVDYGKTILVSNVADPSFVLIVDAYMESTFSVSLMEI